MTYLQLNKSATLSNPSQHDKSQRETKNTARMVDTHTWQKHQIIKNEELLFKILLHSQHTKEMTI